MGNAAKGTEIEIYSMVRFHTGGAIGVECEWWSLGYFFTLPQKGWDWEGGEENGVLSP